MREPTRRVFCLAVAVLVASVVPFCGVKFGAPAWLTLSAWLVAVVIPFITDWIIYVRPIVWPRTCDTCGSGMAEGYYSEGDGSYYCCDGCLYVNGYTPEQFTKDYDDGNGFIFWTDWHDEYENENRKEFKR